MAKVYEAMLLLQGDAPEATKQFLNDYNFSEVIPDPELHHRETDPLDLNDLNVASHESYLPAVETNVAVAAAIAESVDTLATSLDAPLPVDDPAPFPPQMEVVPPVKIKDLVPPRYRAEFRQLAEIVLRTAEQRTLQAVVVCGVDPSDRADFVTENLSLALAETPALRIARFSLLSPSAAVVPNEAAPSFQIKIYRTPIENLCQVVPLHGPVPISQLLRECDIEKMIEMLKQRFDFVLLETDAVNWTDEVATFAGKADGVILVGQKESMHGPAMETARRKLQQTGARLLGAVVNRSHEQEQFQRVA